MGRGGMMLGGGKARDFNGTMRKLLGYLKAYRLQLGVAIIFAVASTVFTVVGPKILGLATTKLFEGVIAQLTGSGAGIDFVYIGNIILLMVGLYLVASVFAYIQGWIMAGVSMKVTYRFRKDIAEKINRMPLRYFDGTNHGEVLSRVTNDVDTVSQTLNQSLSQIITRKNTSSSSRTTWAMSTATSKRCTPATWWCAPSTAKPRAWKSSMGTTTPSTAPPGSRNSCPACCSPS